MELPKNVVDLLCASIPLSLLEPPSASVSLSTWQSQYKIVTSSLPNREGKVGRHHKVIHQVAVQSPTQGKTGSHEGSDQHLGLVHQVKEQGKKSKVRKLLGGKAQDAKVHEDEEINEDHPVALEKKEVVIQRTDHKEPVEEQMPRAMHSKQAAEDASVTHSNYYVEMGPDEQPRARPTSPSQSLPPTTRPAGAGWQCRAGLIYRLVAV